jgi:AMMECR1
MADTTARRLKEGEGLLVGALRRPLGDAERRQVARDLLALLSWQRDLVRWRKPRSRVDALPYVALYARGKLLGCFGADGGEPGERLARAFLRSYDDTRFGGIPEAVRGELAAEVYWARDVTRLDPERIEATFEPGTHGLGVVRAGAPVVLLPSVARDNGYGARAMLEALLRKARVEKPGEARFFTFEAESVVARLEARVPKKASPLDAAAAWLARLVQKDGSLVFAVDARSGAVARVGAMHHARVAAAVQALAAHGGYPKLVSRARKRLALDAARALSGGAVEAWPEDPAKVAGTLAHLARAGVDVKKPLLAMSERPEVVGVPWHAAQVATALGPDAPESLVRACVAALDAQPWAPWTVLALAASRDGDGGSESAVAALVASVRTDPPHRGGVNKTPIPEVALTSLTVEALRSARPGRAVRAAIERGVAFISACQVSADRVPAAFSPDASVGAFPGSPVSSGLRADVTAHAYLAMEGGRRRSG